MTFWGRLLDPLLERARELHPERYAPNGEALIEYAGTSWAERLAAWTARQSGPPLSAPAPAPVRELTVASTTPDPVNRESDDAAARVVAMALKAERELVPAAVDLYDLEPAIPDALDEPPIPERDPDAPYERIRDGGQQ